MTDNFLSPDRLNTWRGDYQLTGRLTGHRHGLSQDIDLPSSAFISWSAATHTFALSGDDGPPFSVLLFGREEAGLGQLYEFLITVPTDNDHGQSYDLPFRQPLPFGDLAVGQPCQVDTSNDYSITVTRRAATNFRFDVAALATNDDPVGISHARVTLTLGEQVELAVDASLANGFRVEGTVSLTRR